MYSYKGSMSADQIFDSDMYADAQFYMPEFDVCVEPAYRPGQPEQTNLLEAIYL